MSLPGCSAPVSDTDCLITHFIYKNAVKVSEITFSKHSVLSLDQLDPCIMFSFFTR